MANIKVKYRPMTAKAIHNYKAALEHIREFMAYVSALFADYLESEVERAKTDGQVDIHLQFFGRSETHPDGAYMSNYSNGLGVVIFEGIEYAMDQAGGEGVTYSVVPGDDVEVDPQSGYITHDYMDAVKAALEAIQVYVTVDNTGEEAPVATPETEYTEE